MRRGSCEQSRWHCRQGALAVERRRQQLNVAAAGKLTKLNDKKGKMKTHVAADDDAMPAGGGVDRYASRRQIRRCTKLTCAGSVHFWYISLHVLKARHLCSTLSSLQHVVQFHTILANWHLSPHVSRSTSGSESCLLHTA